MKPALGHRKEQEASGVRARGAAVGRCSPWKNASTGGPDSRSWRQASSLLAATRQPTLTHPGETRHVAQRNRGTCAEPGASGRPRPAASDHFTEASGSLDFTELTLLSHSSRALYGKIWLRLCGTEPQTRLVPAWFWSTWRTDLPESLRSDLLRATALGVGAVGSVVPVSAHL